MEWFAWIYDFNKKAIVKYNIFDNCVFREGVEKILKKRVNKEEFCSLLDKELFYTYMSRFEYETTISSFPPMEDVRKKIDVYEQVMMNFDAFAYYVWCNKRGRGIWDKLTTRRTITTER